MFYVKLIFFFCFSISVLTFPVPSQGADWKIFYQGTSGDDPRSNKSVNYYYNKESIVKPSKGIVQVWFKTTLGDDDTDNLAGKDGLDEAEQYSSLIEINCKTKSYKIIEETPSDVSEANEKRIQSSAGQISRRLSLDSALGALWSNLCE